MVSSHWLPLVEARRLPSPPSVHPEAREGSKDPLPAVPDTWQVCCMLLA